MPCAAKRRSTAAANEPLHDTHKEEGPASANESLPWKDELLNIGEHSNMIKEIQQGKTLPEIQTEADFQAASERGYQAASEYLNQHSKPFSEWTVNDLTKLHRLYFDEIYPHAGQLRQPGDLAAFSGRVGADSKNIQAELQLLTNQVKSLSKDLEGIDTPTGLSRRIGLIAFVHARLALIHPFQDGNGRWTRLITSALEKEWLPNTQRAQHVPRAIYMHALKELPSNLGPLMNYHAERYGLRPSTLKAVRPTFPGQVTLERVMNFLRGN